MGGHKINDYRNNGSELPVWQVITKSSNLGTARIANMIGPEKQREFLSSLGFTKPTSIEMIEAILNQQPGRIELREKLARIYRKEGQNTNALRQYRRILRDSEPDDELLLEAAELYDRLGLSWDAKNVRERITQ